ncbi:uncharacterized protein LOC107462657 [Arachis duranensis]|uniref:Uncharacterized protein LOC107462657 n=1 Tax=Arachis duranensis TaxID=130453 RepID=A0A6P4C2P9_ARADU|nr:uncharacterized protein LOC107462657 [Arachis duranensis]
MEPAKIDWKRVAQEWNFVEDALYENINAPKWVDFLSLDHYSLNHVDDEAWFCRPDCKHPKTAEDFLRSKTPSKASVSENLPLGDRNRRDAKIKRRVSTLPSASPPDGKSRFNQDSENQNPNVFTPPLNPFKYMKAAVKSSEEKKPADDTFMNNKAPSLRSTLSAKNLFAGRPILNQITEFCNELKKLATRARERENAENLNPLKSEEAVEKSPSPVQPLAELDRREKERKPLIEVGKAEKLDGASVNGKLQRKKRPDGSENVPISLNIENVRHKREELLQQQVRTNPPSPQCFSATRIGPNKATPSKAPKSRLMERAILQEVEQNQEIAKEFPAMNSRSNATIVDGKGETKPLDMLWFLKPCTLSS